MKRVVLVLLLLLSLGCTGSADEREPARVDSSPEETAGTQVSRAASIYASVIRQLVTKDHTFGGGDPGFEVVYVMDGAVEGAAKPGKVVDASDPDDAFTASLKAALQASLKDIPPVEFVVRRDSVVAGAHSGSSPGRVKNAGVLITLGPIQGNGKRVEVANSLWIDGLAGQWLTYVLKNSRGAWKVTGTTGPIAIS